MAYFAITQKLSFAICGRPEPRGAEYAERRWLYKVMRKRKRGNRRRRWGRGWIFERNGPVAPAIVQLFNALIFSRPVFRHSPEYRRFLHRCARGALIRTLISASETSGTFTASLSSHWCNFELLVCYRTVCRLSSFAHTRVTCARDNRYISFTRYLRVAPVKRLFYIIAPIIA